MIRILLGLLPVLTFLALLVLMDSYKLLPVKTVIQAVAAGCIAAVLCLFINPALMNLLKLEAGIYSRYAGPAVEEIVKALFVVYPIRRRKVGFLVDAAIVGFAVGAGFAVFENMYFHVALDSSSVALWIVRGFGTAVTHGSVTAIFAILSMGLLERHSERSWWLFLPGLGVATAIHSLFNHFILPPILSTAVLLVVLPFMMLFVFNRSEQATRQWLGVGFDTDAELLELLLSDGIGQSKVGRYFESLKSKFPGSILGDMLCLLRIHLELSIRAKGILMAREAGLVVEIDEDVRSSFQELKFLEKSIGPTGQLAMHPFLSRSSRDLWQLYMLERS